MEINKIPTGKRMKFYNALDTYTRSLTRRGVYVLCQAHSNTHGTIDIEVMGKRGIVRKNVIISYDSRAKIWIAICDGYEHKMDNLSDITIVVRAKINQLKNIVVKL